MYFFHNKAIFAKVEKNIVAEKEERSDNFRQENNNIY